LGAVSGSKEFEILVLRHELTILRRQLACPQVTPHDRLDDEGATVERGATPPDADGLQRLSASQTEGGRRTRF
jgi:hypothetical protein